MTPRTLLLSTFCLATVAVATPALAQGSIEIGGFGSYTRFDTSLALGTGMGGGGRIGVISGQGYNTFMLEAEGAVVMREVGAGTIRYIPARARLLYALPVYGDLSLLLGGGGVRNDYYDGVAADAEWGYTGLVGLRMRLGPFMTLRVDGLLDYMANPINETPDLKRTMNQSLHAGLQFPIWTDQRGRDLQRERPATPPQPVPQQVAQAAPPPAPTPAPTPAPAAAAAPQRDSDGDGVPDTQDSCPNTPPDVMVDKAGCPVYRDSDGDGVIDSRDLCPGTPPGTEVDGRGCPIKTPVKEPAAEPVRDSDGDGVPDPADRCPNTPAATQVDANGCPIIFRPTERTVTLRGVTFASGRDEVTPGSLAILDDVARQLIAAPAIRLEVAGHTDSQGAHTSNVRLSLKRAEAVRAYLVMKGVPGDRLVARGYGPDHPIADNTTAGGRAMNRRVELRRLD